MGAAREKIMRWPRAARLERPCFKRTEVSPNAAGALCTIMAINITKPSFVFRLDAEAPIAMPSAAAWMTKPVVVARLRVCFAEGVKE